MQAVEELYRPDDTWLALIPRLVPAPIMIVTVSRMGDD
jgi:hypothetical protein